MNIWLKEISVDDGKEYLDLLNELSSYDDTYAKPIPEPIDQDDFERFKNNRVRLSKKGEFPDNICPTNTYWVMLDTKPLGYATLKQRANFNKIGGHFGCCLKKEFQNKGIGKIVSEELSLIAFNIYNIKNIIYTVKKENNQSRHSLEKIGATFICEKDGYLFYEVDLSKKDYINKRGKINVKTIF